MSDKMQVKKLANEAIKALYKKNGKADGEKLERLGIDEKINWGDLGCWGIEIKGVVYIEEASPDAINFQNYIKNYIEDRVPLFIPIEVKTEW